MSKSCLIIGGGIAGITAALSLTKIGISCTIYELRATLATIGGSINLTPNALRLLEYLGVEVYGCRVDSIEIFSLHTGIAAHCRKEGISVVYDSKLVSIKDESEDRKVTAVFANSKEVQTDFILGCDGIHSAVRTQYVEPSRLSTYTDVAVAYSVIDGKGIDVHFRQTCMNSGRFGSLLTSYVGTDRTKIYLGAVMETREQIDKQGWRLRGNDHQKTLDEIDRRYKDSAIPCVDELVKRVDDFVFYPVYNLGPGGIWSRRRVLLLGDAAHGMPPQGESTGLAIEDDVLLARILSSSSEMTIQGAFRVYEKTRRPRIDTAYKEAIFRWEGVKDRSWFTQKVIEWLLWAFLWYKTDAFESSVSYDVREEQIVLSS